MVGNSVQDTHVSPSDSDICWKMEAGFFAIGQKPRHRRSFAIFAAIRRASSRVSSLAAERRPGFSYGRFAQCTHRQRPQRGTNADCYSRPTKQRTHAADNANCATQKDEYVQDPHHDTFPRKNLRRFSSSGSFAIFTAIRLASSLLSNFAAERRPTGWLIF
jgi:hypothetical protein